MRDRSPLCSCRQLHSPLPFQPPPLAVAMAETVDFASGDGEAWRAALDAYDRRLAALDKPDLLDADSFYRHDLPLLLHRRDPDPYLAKPELVQLMQWKLSRGKWRSGSLPAPSSFFPLGCIAQLHFKFSPCLGRA
uniref:Uncharacterized protein n=1 Tax=Aegilops tauschii subsp. strangulata TaxID=200361 RepID=A0A453HA50_AEGTS